MLIDLKPEQIDYIYRLCAGEANGSAEFVPDTGYRHADADVNHAHDLMDALPDWRAGGEGRSATVYVAEVEGFDGLYLFEYAEDRDAFVRARAGETEPERWVATGESPLNTRADAANLIQAQHEED
jgi:hypothetical protein